MPIQSLYVFWTLIGALATAGLVQYPGQGLVYVLFTLAANALLYAGFRKNAIFFDAFIGVFFWLGFWLKLTVRVAFFDSRFHVATGHFDGSGAAFDRCLLVASCAFAALLTASLIRERYLFRYPAAPTQASLEGLRGFYERNRKAVLLGFVLLAAAVALTNFYFGIYQRGMIPRTQLPFGLGGIYSWLLLFGLASFSALILHFEFVVGGRTSYAAAAVMLAEGFLSSVSLLSRGMVLNTGALGYGLMRALGVGAIQRRLRFWLATLVAFAMLFGCSLVLINYVRMTELGWGETAPKADLFAEANRTVVTQIVLDRWVGIEGVMAVSSHPAQGWDLWSRAWQERASSKLSFYDEHLITSPYRDTQMTRHHHISLPGMVAFFFYPGSYVVLFLCMLALGMIAAGVEASVFLLGGRNVVLCALLAEVVASRYAHFGYAPSQSYLLLGALFLNLFLIYLADRALLYFGRKYPPKALRI